MREIRTVTVLGSNGTMGANVAAIFASFGGAKVYMVSRDIEKSRLAADRACKSVRAGSIKRNLVPADYSMLEKCVAESDLIFESTAEKLPVKLEVAKMVSEYVTEGTVLCSGTSGLSVNTLADCYPDNIKTSFFGVHMFNPPYSMTLCELISTEYSDKDVKEQLKSYLQKTLLRTVIEVKDSPAFLANRIGFQFINSAMQYAEKYQDNGGIDYIDSILGKFTGRSMAPLVTADFVGLDVHKAIVDNIYSNTDDYKHESFALPGFVQTLIDEKKLGRKSGGGLYKTEIIDNTIKKRSVYDISTGMYREKINYVFPFAETMKANLKEGKYEDAMKALVKNRSQEAQLCLEMLLNYILYSLVCVQDVSFDISFADDAMATGFNWCPPLAMADALSGITDIETLFEEYIDKDILRITDTQRLLYKAGMSEYDFRPYFKSSK